MPRSDFSPSDRAQVVKRCRAALMDCEVSLADWRKRFSNAIRAEVEDGLTTEEKVAIARSKKLGEFHWLSGHARTHNRSKTG